MEEIIKPYGYIYKTTNLINGKIYVGKKESPEFDQNYVGSGEALWGAIKKYGRENFFTEFLIPCFSLEELNAEERFLIAWFDCRAPKGYNIAEGGDGGDVTRGMTTEQYNEWRKKISDSKKGNLLGENNPFYGKKHDEATKIKMSKAKQGENHPFYGKHFSDEHKQKLRESNLGKEVSDETREKLRLSHLGKTWTDESKLKVRQTRRSPEYKDKMLSVWKSRTYHKICVVCGKQFTSNGSKARYCSEECRQKSKDSGIANNYSHTEETKAKISQAMSGETNPFYGKHHTEESRKKISEANKDRYSNPDYVDPRKGTTRSAETKARISEARKKQKFRVKCKQCGQEFLANSPNKYQLCSHCKEVMKR